MNLIQYKSNGTKVLKYAFACMTFLGLTACGLPGDGRFRVENEHGNGPRYDGPHNQGPQLGEEELPDDLKDVTLEVLEAGNELFSLKLSGDSNSLETSFNGPNLNANGNYEFERLYIVDPKGKAKPFMKNAEVEQMHVVKNGKNGTAYLARLKENFTHRRNMSANGTNWLIIKEGEKVTRVTRKKDFFFMNGKFVGQTETDGWLVFEDGNMVDMNGKQKSYGKGIESSKVRRAEYVSGDMVAITREVFGKQSSLIVEVTRAGGAKARRKGFGEHWVPRFVEVAPGKGLVSNWQKSIQYTSGSRTTQITNLDDELNENGGDTRAAVLQPNEIGDCIWFNSAIKITGRSAALLKCYVSEEYVYGSTNYNDYRLMWIEPNGKNWTTIPVMDLKDDPDRHSSEPFSQGNGFTLLKSGSDVYMISHTTRNVTKIKPKLTSIFEMRPSKDLKKFLVVGEDNYGERYRVSYDAEGVETGRDMIDIQDEEPEEEDVKKKDKKKNKKGKRNQ